MVIKYLFHYTMKYSKQISVLIINKLYKNTKNADGKVYKNALHRKLFTVFLEMS